MTPLYPTFRKRIDDAVELLIKQQVTPWSFLTAGPPFRIKAFEGYARNSRFLFQKEFDAIGINTIGEWSRDEV